MHTEKIDLYVCDTCGKRFATVEKCELCEKSHKTCKRITLHYYCCSDNLTFSQRDVSAVITTTVQHDVQYESAREMYWYIDCVNTPENILEARRMLRLAAAKWFYSKSIEADTIDINIDSKQ